ncbi:hypothetical protein EX30DRAFT_397650 [Ascodesmis nigricans]|uniref:ABM domain-containing protein n=1 Tax=Ascodesmis nigricans TaxID=341454 RepID=A0A4S2MNI0_9PEZI|nr:hypothetical protein EX30DRAFT_397650 [Ascodesmis nigricans]
MPVIECVTVELNPGITIEDASRQQANAISTHVDKAAGLISVSWGFHKENPRRNTWFLTWESVAHHITYTQSPSYPPFLASISTFCTPLGFYHVPLTPDPSTLLATAPVVELFTATLEDATDKEEWVNGLAELMKVGEETLPKEGVYGFAHGWSVEQERRFVLLAGWESREVHEAWERGLTGEQRERGLGPLGRGVKGVELVHVDLREGSGKWGA